jgi:rubredoxin
VLIVSEFVGVVRQLLDDERVCPRCKERNVPGAKPTITREQDGSFSCSNCGHGWIHKENVA